MFFNYLFLSVNADLVTETTDKDITDVLASVEETYGYRMPAADGSEQGDGSIGSLELSLTPTQDVDGTEPVTDTSPTYR